MAEKPGGSVSTANTSSSDPLKYLTFSSNSGPGLVPYFPNSEPSSGNNYDQVKQALFGSASSAFTRVERPDGSLPKSNYRNPDCLADLNDGPNTNPETEFFSPSSAFAIADKNNSSVPASDCPSGDPQGTNVTPSLIAQLPSGFNSLRDYYVSSGQELPGSLRGTADGGIEGIVGRKAHEVIGINPGTQPSRRENAEDIRDEEMDDLIEQCFTRATSDSDRDEIQHESAGTLNVEKPQGNCKLPKIGNMFSSEEEAYEFYKNHATYVGFYVRKGKVQRLANRTVRKKYFYCSRQGTRLEKQFNKTTKYKRKETRTNCEAMIQFTIEKNGVWVVSKFNAHHNHELGKSQRNISDAHEILDSANEAGMEKDAADAQNDEFHGTDHERSFQYKLSLMDIIDFPPLAKYLESSKVSDPSFFYKEGIVDKTVRTAVFWRDSISKKDYDSFGDVLIFDTTFRRNFDDIICAPFVGVNHHRQYILLGCAFLLEETTELFIWLLETFLEAMDGRQPRTIFTDGCPELANAIGKVLPETQHLLCMWCICQNAKKYLSDSYQQSGFQSLFYKCIFYCHSKENFQSTWASLCEEYNLQENPWLQDLYMQREKWSHIFSKKTFSAGIESVRSGKGITDVFHNITSGMVTLKELARQYKQEAKMRRKEESWQDLCEENVMTIIVPNNSMEIQAVNIYTHAMSKLFQEKLRESRALAIEEIASGGTIVTYKLTEEDQIKESILAFNCSDCTIACSCKNFESMGILCIHALKVLNVRKIFEIPDQYILKRWTKWAKEMDERKRSLILDQSKLMDKALLLVTKYGRVKDAQAIVDKYLCKALKKVSEHLKRKQYPVYKIKDKELEDLEDVNEVAGSNTSGSEAQKILLNSPCGSPDEILKSRRMSKMERHQTIKDKESQPDDESHTHHQPAIKVARGERIQSPSTGASTARISINSRVEGLPPKYTNTCPQTQIPSTSTLPYVEANPIMIVDELLRAPLKMPTRPHCNQGNLEKDEGNQVLVQTNPPIPILPNDETPMVKAPLKQKNFHIVVKNFEKLVDTRTKQNCDAAINVMVDQEVFQLGKPSSIPIWRDELMNLINFEMIGAAVIQLYMCALYNKVKEVGYDRIIRFVAPAGVDGHNEDINADQLFYALNSAEREQLFFYPYNIGLHWVMVIIYPWKQHFLYFDSLGNGVDTNVDNILAKAYEKLDDGKLTQRRRTYVKVMCPRQPAGSVQCGYYVMRYMKDVIDSPGTHPAKVFNNNECYGREMIDEVRVELMNFIRDNIRSL